MQQPLSIDVSRIARIVRLGAFTAALIAWAAPTPAATTNVVFQNFTFNPATVTIQVGDTVVWTNAGGVHTVTGLGAEAFCGPAAIPVSCSTTFMTAGTYPYQCNFHQAQGMVGSVIVVSASGTNGPPATNDLVTIISPTNHAVLTVASNVTLLATNAAGVDLRQVQFLIDGKLLGVATNAPFTLTTVLGHGQHELTALGIDNTGKTNQSPAVTVTVQFEIEDPIPQKIPESAITIELHPVVDGLVCPLGMAVPDDGSGRMFVLDQVGMIYVIQDGAKLDAPFLDVKSRLVALNPGYDERGLLGVATHPNFAQHPLVYTYTSEPNGPTADFSIPLDAGKTNNHQSVIAEWRVDAANTNRLDPASRREILRLDKPQSNHNGGTLRFGPDGFLYFTVGDGGRADDMGDGHLPGGNAQSKSRILGKVLRIDVDTRNAKNGQYGIPSDNPFVGESNVVQEIYAYGLRNPYSYSFDRQTGELYLGDVGQNQIEEVDKIVKGGNYGWSIKEGSFLFNANDTNDGFVTQTPVRDVPPDLIDPIAQYDHDEGNAVIGGFVYRGAAIPALQGKYVTGDLGQEITGRLFVLEGTELKELRIGLEDRALGMFLKGFGQDSSGELYVFGSTNLGPAGTAGKMLRIAPAPNPIVLGNFAEHHLVSDQAGQADLVDTNLVNAWGLATGPATPFWVADNHTGLSTLYNSTGGVQSLVVTIPAPPGASGPATPTGIIFNSSSNFVVTGGPARFIFATEDGTLAGWNSGSNADLKVDNSMSNAIYKAVAMGTIGSSNFLYAANFYAGTIDVFDGNFAPVTLTNAFKDPRIPEGFAPFNIENLNGQLYVAYAKQDDDREDDERGRGNGYVDVFDTSGTLVQGLITQGPLNSPWGLALAPQGFSPFGGALLVGNFGNGNINAFNPTNGTFLGTLRDQQGNPIQIEGLWAIKFGNGALGGDTNTLYFTAGPGDEEHGLFGSIAPAAPINAPIFTAFHASPTNFTVSWTGGNPPYEIQGKTNIGDAVWVDLMSTTNHSATLERMAPMGFFRISTRATNSVQP